MTARAIPGIARAIRLQARCKYVARATLFSSVKTRTVAHFSDLSDSVFACVLGWMSNRECILKGGVF